MSDFEISIKSNLDAFAAELNDFATKQMPYAASLTLNRLAKMVVEGEAEEISETFPTATPFTKRGVSFIPSNKNRLEAVVFVKDIQAEYLEPYEFTGAEIPAGPSHVAMLRPIGIGVNQYGNIPRGKIKALKAQPTVFSGEIKLKNGSRIGGVFQRLKGGKGGKRLKILIRFADPKVVHQQLHYFDRAQKIVDKNVDAVMSESMDRALATAK